MNYYISDLHLGFEDMLMGIHSPARPFGDVQQMNEVIISNINERVTDKDKLYILGDVACRDYNPVDDLKKIHCEKILIIGNHDGTYKKGLLSHRSFRSQFESIYERKVIYDNDTRITLFHYPMIEWDGYWKKHWLFYGHIHYMGSTGTAYVMKHIPTAVNVAADLHDFKPMTAKELMEWNLTQVEQDELTSNLCPFTTEVKI